MRTVATLTSWLTPYILTSIKERSPAGAQTPLWQTVQHDNVGGYDLGRDPDQHLVIAIRKSPLPAFGSENHDSDAGAGLGDSPSQALPIPSGYLTKRATARLAGAGVNRLRNNFLDKRIQILGGLIQAAATAVGEPDQPIPSPTTSPLPVGRARQ